MKILIYIISLAAVSLIIYNLIQIDTENFFSKDNLIVSGSGIWKIVNFKKINNISDKIKKDDGGW